MSTATQSLSRIQAVGFRTIVIREYGRIIRIWAQTLVPSAVTTTLYFVIFGSLVGRRIGAMGGFDYIAYIAPGLIMMAVITNSYGNVVSSFFGAKFGKHIEELLVSPLPNWVIIAGYVCGGLMRGVMVGLVVTAVALVFTWLHSHHLQVHNIFVVLGAVVLTSAVFSLGGLINAIFAKNFDQVNWIPSFVLMLRNPLTTPPVLPGYVVKLVDDHTLELEVSKDQSLNDIFAQLAAQRIDVISMRNKVNRLEEMFMRLVENRAA